MKRKHAIIFLVLGLLLIALYGLYSYTNIDKNNDSSSEETKIVYDYVKSSNINEKTKISFPVLVGMSLVEYSSDDFNKIYINSTNTKLFVASIYNDSETIEMIAEKQFINFREQYIENGNNVEREDISCDYLCQKYKVYDKDNVLQAEEFVMYYKVSDDEIFNLTYYSEKTEISQEEINNVVKNIKISNDAEYLNSRVADGKVNVQMKLQKNKTIEIVLDSKVYQEEANGNNGIHSTKLVNLQNNALVVLAIKLKTPSKELLADIDMYFGTATRQEIANSKWKIYGYEAEDVTKYAILIDDETVLLINPTEGTIDINDFLNITIKDA